MPRPDTMSLYTNQTALRRAVEGKNPMAACLRRVAEANDMQFKLYHNTTQQRLRAALRSEYALSQMLEPWDRNVLVLRPAYLPRYWRIETTHERHDFEVATRVFDADTLDPDNATAFVADARRKRYGAEWVAPREDGYIYVALQAVLTRQRSFQSMSPLQMLETTMAHSRGRKVIVTLHPGADLEEGELRKLHALVEQHENLSLEDGPATLWLPGCTYVVAQNSGAAFEGFFWHKPAVLFAKADFHHICASVPKQGAEAAFAQVEDMVANPPAFDRYIAWFLRDNCVNPENPQAIKRVTAILKRRGWDVE